MKFLYLPTKYSLKYVRNNYLLKIQYNNRSEYKPTIVSQPMGHQQIIFLVNNAIRGSQEWFEHLKTNIFV